MLTYYLRPEFSARSSSTCYLRVSNSFLRFILKRNALSRFWRSLITKERFSICLHELSYASRLKLARNGYPYLFSFLVDLDCVLFLRPRFDLAGASGTSCSGRSMFDVVSAWERVCAILNTLKRCLLSTCNSRFPGKNLLFHLLWWWVVSAARIRRFLINLKQNESGNPCTI